MININMSRKENYYLVNVVLLKESAVLLYMRNSGAAIRIPKGY